VVRRPLGVESLVIIVGAISKIVTPPDVELVG
jgi:hypothetical protein